MNPVAERSEVAASDKPVRTFIACVRCKSRKRRCDGRTPKCANCVANSAECVYAPERKTRGRGKKPPKKTRSHEKPLDEAPFTSSSTDFLSGDRTGLHRTAISTIPSTSLDGVLSEAPSSTTVNFGARSAVPAPASLAHTPTPQRAGIGNSFPIFPNFLLPVEFIPQLKNYRIRAEEAALAQKFMPLMPYHMARRLVKNSFADIMANHRLFDESSFLTLLDTQYAGSDLHHPGENPARWAAVNAIVALAIRAKTAAGSEDAFSDVMNGFYKNATTVLPELILREPTLLSMRALLTMAVFAWGVPDTRASAMLAVNAWHQLEFLCPGLAQARDILELGALERVKYICEALSILDRDNLLG
ncbi:hypothetical protein BX600DRAFT_64429 [Xylariales sp. PMI_506]|nr:hypothetical protein BX600DRAFT_64429 [Xylariales sp. PMI_506]